MKKYIWMIFVLSLLFLAWCWFQTDQNIQEILENWSWEILTFLEHTIIEEHGTCKRWEDSEQMFVSFALLWTGKSVSWNVEYYLMTSGEWMYLDKRWNISSSCGFAWMPTRIEVEQTDTWFVVLDYQVALDGSEHYPSTKEMFSPQAFKKREKADYTYNTELSPFQKAQKYFWIDFWTWWNFECSFCDQARYDSWYFLDSKDWAQEWYSIYSHNKNEKNSYILFTSEGNFENHNSRDEWTGTWIFWKDKTTILVDAYPYHTYDRYIVQYHSWDELHITREILHK